VISGLIPFFGKPKVHLSGSCRAGMIAPTADGCKRAVAGPPKFARDGLSVRPARQKMQRHGIVSALFATAATAAPLITNQSVAQDSNIQNVRMVCNENDRCWGEHRDRRVIIRDSYGYDAPRERYIERRGYEERGGIGFRAPGVSMGIGTDRY
jgi:hypothetical protein